MLIAGVDEVGRGALAGPVIAAAVILPDIIPKGIKDSKKLSDTQRKHLFIEINACALGIGIGIVCNEDIDKSNILQATMCAMSEAILALPIKPDHIFIDGNKCPVLPAYSMEAIIKGDDKVPAISAASIIAKVTRDNLMDHFHTHFPYYEFDKNKGYGTCMHYDALFKHGATKLHRLSFNLTRQEMLF